MAGEPEIILNLWYVYDDLGMIYSLRARCYVATGPDEEKLALLQRFAATDYLIASSFPVPERFHTTIITECGQQKYAVAGKAALDVTGGVQVLFEDAFAELEKAFPATTKLTIGRSPLVCITPLLGNDDSGELRPMTAHRKAL